MTTPFLYRALTSILTLGFVGFSYADTTKNKYFRKPQHYKPAGATPGFVRAGDVNNDGRFDLVFSHDSWGSVSVMIQNDEERFISKGFKAGKSPWPLLVRDFNEDGHLDIIVGNSGATNFSFFPGRGDGEFPNFKSFDLGTAPSSSERGEGESSSLMEYDLGPYPSRMVSDDLNGDGHLDLAILCGEASLLKIFQGDGKGEFVETQTLQVPKGSTDLQVGQFRGNKKKQLVIASAGKGRPTPSLFQIGWLGDIRKFFRRVASWFMESKAEVLVFDVGTDGLLKKTLTLPLKHPPHSMALEDWDGDGKLDIAVGLNEEFASQGWIAVFRSENEKKFEEVVMSEVPEGTYHMDVADVNDDGYLDLATVNSKSSVALLWGAKDAKFERPLIISTLSSKKSDTRDLLLKDLNSDGAPDLVTTQWNHKVLVFWGKGKPKPAEGPVSVELSKLRVTGPPELRANGQDAALLSAEIKDENGRAYPGKQVVFSVEGEGGILNKNKVTTDKAGIAKAKVKAGKVGEKKITAKVEDGGALVTLSEKVMVSFLPSPYQVIQSLNVGEVCHDLSLAELDGGGLPEILLLCSEPRTLRTFEMDPRGKPSLLNKVELQFQADLMTEPLQLKDKEHMVVMGQSDEAKLVAVNISNTGAISKTANINLPLLVRGAVLRDMNRDSKPDLIAWGLAQNEVCPEGKTNVAIYLNQGHGDFSLSRELSVGRLVSNVEVSDLNADGINDLVVSTWDDITSNSEISLFYGTRSGAYQAGSKYHNSSAWGFWTGVEDLDKDGNQDLIIPTRKGLDILYGASQAQNRKREKLLRYGDHLWVAAEISLQDMDQDGNQDLVVLGLKSSKFFHEDPKRVVAILYSLGGTDFSKPLFFELARQPAGRSKPLTMDVTPGKKSRPLIATYEGRTQELRLFGPNSNWKASDRPEKIRMEEKQTQDVGQAREHRLPSFAKEKADEVAKFKKLQSRWKEAKPYDFEKQAALLQEQLKFAQSMKVSPGPLIDTYHALAKLYLWTKESKKRAEVLEKSMPLIDQLESSERSMYYATHCLFGMSVGVKTCKKSAQKHLASAYLKSGQFKKAERLYAELLPGPKAFSDKKKRELVNGYVEVFCSTQRPEKAKEIFCKANPDECK